MQDRNSTNQRPMGFAGLARMVSNVDEVMAEEAGKFATAAASNPALSVKAAVQDDVSSDAAPPQNKALEAKTGEKTDKTRWYSVIVILAVAGAIGLINRSNNAPSTQNASSYNTPANDTPANGPSIQTNNSVVQQPQAATVIDEAPPVGKNLILTRAQLHYCFAESVRLDAGRDVLNLQNESDTTRFNNLVTDYNSRCSSYRYHQRDLDSANQDVQAKLYQYQSEGRLRFTGN